MLQKVKEQIRQEPRSFDMGDWLRPGTNQYGTACGTAACIAGFTCIAHWKEQHPEQWKDREEVTLSEIVSATHKSYHASCALKAAALLGIDHRSATFLFYTSSWPEPFKSDYHRATNGCEKNGYKPDHERRAEVACDRIDHFMATGE